MTDTRTNPSPRTRARRWILVGLAGAATLWFVRPSAHKTPAADTATAEAVPAAAMPRERAAVPAPPRAAGAPEAPPAAPTPKRAGKHEDDPNAPYALDEKPDDLEQRAAERSMLGKRFDGEAADAAWTNASGQRVTELLARANVQGSALRAVDCRQTICRFVLASAGGTQGEVGGLIQVARDLELETWLHPEKQDDGSWRMEVFFPKDGYRLSGGGGRIDERRRVVDAPDLHQASRGG